MNIRRSWTLFCYDNWLDLYGTPRRERRDLVRELKANLAEAEADAGWDAARRGINVRALAHDNAAVVRDPRRPAWNVGIVAGGATLLVVLYLLLFSTAAFFDGVEAAGTAPGRSVTGDLTFLPGAQATYERTTDGFSMGAYASPWLLLVPTLLAFLLGSRIWRIFSRR